MDCRREIHFPSGDEINFWELRSPQTLMEEQLPAGLKFALDCSYVYVVGRRDKRIKSNTVDQSKGG